LEVSGGWMAFPFRIQKATREGCVCVGWGGGRGGGGGGQGVHSRCTIGSLPHSKTETCRFLHMGKYQNGTVQIDVRHKDINVYFQSLTAVQHIWHVICY